VGFWVFSSELKMEISGERAPLITMRFINKLNWFIPTINFKIAPPKIAQEIAGKFESSNFIREVKAAGGYVNFFVKPVNYIQDIVSQVLKEKDKFGHSTDGKGQTIVMDYSSPNIAKPFSIGHLRSTIIGQAIANLFRSHGYTVVGVNHLGDWGTQFGKQIVALNKYGSIEELISAEDKMDYLFKLYVKFHKEAEKDDSLNDEAREMFAKTEAGDKDARAIRDLLVEHSLTDFKKTYERLGVEFTYYRGESYYADKITDTLKKIESLVETRMSEGALIIDVESYGFPPVLLKKRDGTTLYATRDLAAMFDRWEEFHFDQLLYVVGNEQKLHFQQLVASLEKMKLDWSDKIHHIQFGMIRFKDQKMSTRKGNVIFLNQVLDEAHSRALKAIEEKNPELPRKNDVAEQVGIGAVIFNDLSQKRIKDVIFDWDTMLSFEGDTGPYLQYTHARICSILKKAPDLNDNIDWTLLSSNEEFQLVRSLEKFPPTILKGIEQYEPSQLCSTLLNIASAFNTFYHKHMVIQEDEALQNSRLALISAVKQTLANGLALLNMHAPQEM